MKEIPPLPHSLSGNKTLVLVLHAYTNDPSSMRFIDQAVRELRPESHVIIPELPISARSFESPLRVARSLVTVIEEQIAFRSNQGWAEFDDIVLIGHSLGALLVRKVYLLAGPESAEARFEDSVYQNELTPERPWFRKVSRIILFAGMNRGWSLNHHLRFFRFLLWWVSTFAADTLMAFTNDRTRLVIMNSRRGAPFLTELRLQWLALQRSNRQLQKEATSRNMPIPELALTVQMLGTIDDMVAPSDNIDLATGRDFVYLDVPRSGHSNVIVMNDSKEGRDRREVFHRALCESSASLKSHSIVPSNLSLRDISDKISNVVFVMHGIRDTGYWTQKVARKVEEQGAAPPKIYASETSSYGYFAMIPFLLPSQRRKKVQWLMDQYVEARSLYPDARFSYVGHSNGTYLAARALLDYPSCRFDRVVFAGSVVRTDYDWPRVIERGQVEAVLNYVATADVVVAVLPGAWEIVNLQDLGSAGHNGFRKKHPRVFESKFIPGGHSSAREEDNWNDIASFIVSESPCPTTNALIVPDQKTWVVVAGRTAPFWWAVIIVIVGLVGWCVVLIGEAKPIHHPYIALLIYAWLIMLVLTKV